MGVTKLCLEKDCYLIEYGHWINYNQKKFSRNNIVPKDVLFKVLANKNITGLFKTVYCYDKKDIDNAYLIGDLYFDFDAKDYVEVKVDALRTIDLLYALFGINKNQISIYFSGNKGLHFIINKNILGVKPHKQLNAIYKEIANTIYDALEFKTLDMQIYDNKRLFRIPNTRHEKTGLFKVPITYEELCNLSSDEIRSLAKTQRVIENSKEKDTSLNEKANRTYLEYAQKAIEKLDKYENMKSDVEQTFKSNPPCIKYLYTNGADTGNRNNATAMLTSFLKRKGYDLETSYKLVSDWNSNNSNPLSDYEIKRTCRSIYAKNVNYGCTSFKIFSQCDEDNCPLIPKRKKLNR